MYPLALERNFYPCFWVSRLDYSVSTILHYFGDWDEARSSQVLGDTFLSRALVLFWSIYGNILPADGWEVSSVDSGHSPGL